LRWIIVSDESTDGTDELIGCYAATSKFIRLVQIESKAKRDFRSKVLSVKLGEALLSGLDYDYFANVDADVSFSADYFCRVLSYMEEEKRLGIGGGILLEPFSGGWVKQLSSTAWSVSGPIQVFRRQCYEEIGGYLPLELGGEDTMAEMTARMKGWSVCAFPDVEAYHHRRTGGHISGLQAAYRLGVQEYLYGSHPIFHVLKCLVRITDRPRFLMSTMRMAGYLCYLVRGKAKAVSKEMVRFVRREQMLRLARPLSNLHAPRQP
jgi:biofilm PGA synthesis N-glycosyltransferase PgaC